ncbi:spore germination protein [Priestia megaterium]|nr:spore germination protein [Priestia megaterium]NER43833.1 spore germination protein [Priestia megaterium NBRC 15308 = ATCC 14581]NMM60851.1 spore germination protein [Priestia megaterium]QSF30537.1 spore germination protein [Priestia megaterium]QSF41772.1 spore germination protein [Priestia megaterium]
MGLVLQRKSGENENKQESVSKNSANPFTRDFNSNVKEVRKEIGHNSEVHFREFIIGRTGIRACIVFVEGPSDKDLIDKHILSSLMADFSAES